MAITFYCGSGSPFAWRVWLALEHKQLPYDLKLLSFDKGDTRSPQFLAVNPRGKVPAIVDDGFRLWESIAILEYLEERYPERPLLPKGDVAARATARRLMAETDAWLGKALGKLMEETLFHKGPVDKEALAEAQDGIVAELERFAAELKGDWFLGRELSLADLTIYPTVRLVRRVDDRQPANGIGSRMPAKLADFIARFERLPYAAKTMPPHWKS
jgi:glutathione S-transferase